MKVAKQSAIDQAVDIQKLFSAIDEISAEARQVRLSLERQIKRRKLDIKNNYIELGIELVRQYILERDPVFEMIDYSSYLDRTRFELAVKGKAGLQRAINQLCNNLKREIAMKEGELLHNQVTLEALPSHYQPLFQDYHYLLALNSQTLQIVIEKRIAVFDAEKTRRMAEKMQSDLQTLEDTVFNPVSTSPPSPQQVSFPDKEKYKLILNLLCAKERAIDIARAIRDSYGHNEAVTDIRLSRDYES